MASASKSAMTFTGQDDPRGRRMVAALITGGINTVPTAYLEFAATNKKLDLSNLVGSDIGFWVENDDAEKQRFWGTCISAQARDTQYNEGVYVVEICPWLWFLGRSSDNRIFQNLGTIDIVKKILEDHGFSGDLKTNVLGKDPVREYCVQYRETDLDFIKRLLEERGYYFYFEHEAAKVTMIIADQPNTHGSASNMALYTYSEDNEGAAREQINAWGSNEKVVTGLVTLKEYDFKAPSADLTAKAKLEKGKHRHRSYERYEYPGRFGTGQGGKDRANALIEEDAAQHQIWTGAGRLTAIHAGSLFEIDNHPRHASATDNGFLVTEIAQFLDVSSSTLAAGSTLFAEAERWTGVAGDLLDHIGGAAGAAAKAGAGAWVQIRTMIRAVLKDAPYRGPGLTLRPVISGVHTAIVTGAAGDEIMVDAYGRIKVQFHWDREGKHDEKTTCWVRTMMPWTGKNWGMVGLPRVGQEVVIQFEEGDPDRPICIGMLYNAETMPPYDLPADATRTGVKTNSSKGGGGYNELMFEDKKGDELVRFMAQKDYVQNVINQAHIKVGYPHGDDIRKAGAQADKSLKVEVKQHYDEIVEEGDHSMSVSAGKQTLHVEKNKKETVKGKSELEVTRDKIVTVSQGNWNQTVSTGNIAIKASAGKIEMQAPISITLTCGPSSIKLDPSGVTIKGLNLKNEAGAMFSAKTNGVAEVKSLGIMTISGLPIMIN